MTTLAGCLPALIQAEEKLRGKARALEITYDFGDYGTLRTKAVTAQLIKWRDEAVAAGEPFYRVSPFTRGFHPRGGAFDIRITNWPHMRMSSNQAYATLGQLAASCGLRWGGNFKPTPDIYHFELRLTLDEVTDAYAAFSGIIVPTVDNGDPVGRQP